MKMIEAARKMNRTLLEMQLGILFLGVVCWGLGAFWAADQGYYARSLWFGILMALVNAVHMYRSLDRALDFGESDAAKLITRNYLLRYFFLVILLAIIMVTKVMNPLVVFLGYMSLKGTAYLQPFTHKLCNKFFHETDPVPEAMPEEDASNKESGDSPE